MPIATDFTSVYSKDWDIHFTQCTPGGHLKYTELCNMLQLTAAFHAESGGIAFNDMQAFHQAWVLSRLRIEIDELPYWGQTVTVKTWIVSLENSRSVRALEVYAGGKKLAGCETFWAVINTKLRRPEALALPYGHFELFAGRYATVERVKKVDLPSDAAILQERKVVLSDLDIVNHVNNVRYLEWCLDLLPVATVLESRIKSLDMNFMRELLLGDAVGIRVSDDFADFAVEKADKSCFALEIGLHQM